jgi:YVTN family beta-propeller protein
MARTRFGLLPLAFAGLASVSCTTSTDSNVVASFVVTPNPVKLIRGDSTDLSVTPVDAEGHLVTGISVVFVSNDSDMVTVSFAGRAKSRGPVGATSIQVIGGGAVTEVPVTVFPRPVAVRVAPTDTTMFQGQTFQLTATAFDSTGAPIPGAPVTFESQDNTIATVSAAGLVGAHGPGTVYIAAEVGTLYALSHVAVRDSALGERVPLAGRPFAAAVSPSGVAYVSLADLGQLTRATLPSHSFSNPVAVGSQPTEVVFNSTGTRAYVTNQYGHNVGIVNVATNTQVDTIAVRGDPFAVVVTPGDSIIYVTTNADSVYGFRLATKERIAAFPTFATANGFVVRGDTLLYVSTRAGGAVIEFNLKTRTVARTLAVGGMPQKMLVSQDGNQLYIANEGGFVQFWNLVTGAQIGENLILPGSAGYAIARRPNTGKLYVTTAYFGGGRIYIVDPTTRTITRTLVAGGSTRQVVFNASGTVGFVPNEYGWVDFLK